MNKLVIPLLVVAMLAGCADEEPASAEEPAPTAAPLAEELDGKVVTATTNATLDASTPFVLRGAAGPDKPVHAFEWTIPEDAIVEWRPIPQFSDFVIELLVFDMAPVVPNGTEITEFAFLTYRLDEQAFLGSSYIDTGRTIVQGGLAGGTNTYTPSLSPTLMTIGAGGLEAGDKLGFVLIAEAAEATPVHLVMAPLDERPDNFQPPADADDVLEGRTAVELPLTGSGDGFQHAMYLNLNFFFGTAIIAIEEFTDDITVEDRTERPAEPVATVRDATVSASFPDDGFTRSVAIYFGSDPAAAGTFDISMDLHGLSDDFAGLILETPCAVLICPPTSLLTGTPLMFATAEGSGAASTRFDFDLAAVSDFEFMLTEQVDVGETMETLFGIPAATGAAAFRGLLGDVPPAMLWTEGDDAYLYSGGVLQRYAGLAPTIDAIA